MSACGPEDPLREGQRLTRQPARGVLGAPLASSRGVFLWWLLLPTFRTYPLLSSSTAAVGSADLELREQEVKGLLCYLTQQRWVAHKFIFKKER